jgi:hypothetical protein
MSKLKSEGVEWEEGRETEDGLKREIWNRRGIVRKADEGENGRKGERRK